MRQQLCKKIELELETLELENSTNHLVTTGD